MHWQSAESAVNSVVNKLMVPVILTWTQLSRPRPKVINIQGQGQGLDIQGQGLNLQGRYDNQKHAKHVYLLLIEK